MGRRARCRVRQTTAAGWASGLPAAVHGDWISPETVEACTMSPLTLW